MAVLYMLLRTIDRLVGVAVAREVSLTALSGRLHAIAAPQAGDHKRGRHRHQQSCVGRKRPAHAAPCVPSEGVRADARRPRHWQVPGFSIGGAS